MRIVVFVILFWSAVVGAQPVTPADSPSKTFERALLLYQKGDLDSASVELQKVVTGGSGDMHANVQRARLAMAATLHRMRYHAAALAMLSRIVQEGPTHPLHLEAVKWLVMIGEVPGSYAGSYLRMYRGELEAAAATLDEAGRSALFYQLGQELAIGGEVDEAREILARVAPGSRHSARARLELARLELRRGTLGPGVAAALARAGDPAVADEAARSIAESKYAAGDPVGARAALQELAGVSALAAFARSRIELEQAGTLPSLAEAPVAAFELVVAATACTRGWTDHLVPQAAITVRNASEAIEELLAASDDNAETYEAVERFLEETAARGAAPPRPSELVVRLALARIGAPRALVAELSRELRQLSAADKAWQTTEVAAEILQELAVQHSVATTDLGKLYRERLAAARRALDAVGKALGGEAAAITAGPNTAPGRGLVVNDAMCAFVLGQAPAAAQIAARPATAAPRGTGCAGCASSGDPALVLALPWLLTGAARRGRRPRARARRPGTPGGATPWRGPGTPPSR